MRGDGRYANHICNVNAVGSDDHIFWYGLTQKGKYRQASKIQRYFHGFSVALFMPVTDGSGTGKRKRKHLPDAL